mmetsp:Transcript_41913/g.89982  ORF Transcript_41913/g.89982 Transcript_41913/m.89982 type:complete len:247 (+) Transcript_41913:749-1489(+)
MRTKILLQEDQDRHWRKQTLATRAAGGQASSPRPTTEGHLAAAAGSCPQPLQRTLIITARPSCRPDIPASMGGFSRDPSQEPRPSMAMAMDFTLLHLQASILVWFLPSNLRPRWRPSVRRGHNRTLHRLRRRLPLVMVTATAGATLGAATAATHQQGPDPFQVWAAYHQRVHGTCPDRGRCGRWPFLRLLRSGSRRATFHPVALSLPAPHRLCPRTCRLPALVFAGAPGGLDYLHPYQLRSTVFAE